MNITIRTLKIGVFEKFAPYLPDRLYLRLKYWVYTGSKLHIDNPVTFNEKLQWLKLYGRRPIDTILADKIAVKEYISKTIGSEYVIPLLGVWNSFDDIEFDKLPNQFVLKTSHDSGGVVVCKDKSKLDIASVKTKLSKSLKRNYFTYSRETAYKEIPRKIFAEAYMEDSKTKELRDYKFFCFNGKVHFFKVDFGRFVQHRANYYDVSCKLLNFGEKICPPDYNANIEIPESICQMITLAEKLSHNIPFVRIDFYYIDGRIFFGEFTFSPAGGMGLFTDGKIDAQLGTLITLPNIQQFN